MSKAGRVRKDAWSGYHKTQITITTTETEQGRRGGRKLSERQNGSPDNGCWNVEKHSLLELVCAHHHDSFRHLRNCLCQYLGRSDAC